MSFHQDYPYGSARPATDQEVRRAMRGKGGLPVGYLGGRMLWHSRQAGALVIGGAGSGKFTTVLAHIMADPGRGKGEPPRTAILDPKGEAAAVFNPGGRDADFYTINPFGLNGLPNHSVALLAHLVPGSPMLVADCLRAARTLLPTSGSGDARFFEQKAQAWCSALMRGLVHADGEVSPKSLFDLVGMIRAAPDTWAQMSVSIAALGEPDLAVTYAEMREMAAESRKTFDSVLAEMTNALAFMADPALQRSFTGTAEADFTLDVLTRGDNRPITVFMMMPAELIAQYAPIIRLFFSSLRTVKQNKPHAPTVNPVIDEAARLGRFPEIAEFYSIGRGFGVCPVCIYQDIGQIAENLGPNGATTLSASADLEIYLGGGVRDLKTAQHLSQKLGNVTLALQDALVNERARRGRAELVHGVLSGQVDPMRAGIALRGLAYEMQHQRKQSRALMTPDEILTMPQDKALVLAGGYSLHPFAVDKVPYNTLRSMAGRFLPNPYHDRDLSRVRLRGFWGTRSARVIREAVPEGLRHLPQYHHREWAFIEGYRPKTLPTTRKHKVTTMSDDRKRSLETLRDGHLKAAIWENDHDGKTSHSVQFRRSYRDQDGQARDSDSFFGADLLRLAHLATQSHDRLARLREAAREAPADRDMGKRSRARSRDDDRER